MVVEIATSPGGRPVDPAAWAPARLRTQAPDADVRALLLRLNLYPMRPGPQYSLRRGRRDWQLAIKAFGSRESGLWVSDQDIAAPGGGDLRLRIYTPSGGDPDQLRPVLVWMHGGGFVLGDLYTAGGTCRALAKRSNAIVVAVDYRLAPEHPLAAAHEDCFTAVAWVVACAKRIGGDPERVAVGGDSAGGALAASVAQRCAERGIALRAQVLVYPATDLAGEYASAVDNASGYMLTADAIEWFRSHVRSVSDLNDKDLSPLLADDLSTVAPALVVTAGFDPIRDEGLAYAARLRDAAVATRTLHYADQIHGFLSFDRVLRAGRDGLVRIGATLEQAFDSGGFTPASEAPHAIDMHQWPVMLSPLELNHRWNETRVAQVMAADWIRARAAAVVKRGPARMLRAITTR
jgi:acetyl esterase/lipase